jgi:non-homologous end joining protein Ku
VKLIDATSEPEKIRFRTLNRKDWRPVKGAYVDEAPIWTGDDGKTEQAALWRSAVTEIPALV